jgi:hypothetical protein
MRKVGQVLEKAKATASSFTLLGEQGRSWPYIGAIDNYASRYAATDLPTMRESRGKIAAFAPIKG